MLLLGWMYACCILYTNMSLVMEILYKHNSRWFITIITGLIVHPQWVWIDQHCFPGVFLFMWLALTLCQSQDRLRKSLMSCVHCLSDASEINYRLALYDPSDWRALVPSRILRWTVMNMILIGWSFSAWRAADQFSSKYIGLPIIIA